MSSSFSRKFTPDELPDLSGKVIIVTGGNAGIGYATVQHLARHGAKVYMAARSEQRANAAIEKLCAAGLGPGNGEVVWLPLDYGDPRTAKQAAERFLEEEERLDIIVNSAAILLASYEKTHDGIQDVVMVNYLSPWVFTRTLLPLLKKTAEDSKNDVRIVNLCSEGHRHTLSKLQFRGIDDFNLEFKDALMPKSMRYNLSKLMCILSAKELQRQLDAENVPIIVTSVHPGLVNSDGVQAYAHSVGPILSPIFTLIANAIFVAPEKGAYSTVFAAAAPVVRAEAEKYKGAYIIPPGKLGRESTQSQDPKLARELWQTTEKIVADIGV